MGDLQQKLRVKKKSVSKFLRKSSESALWHIIYHLYAGAQFMAATFSLILKTNGAGAFQWDPTDKAKKQHEILF